MPVCLVAVAGHLETVVAVSVEEAVAQLVAGTDEFGVAVECLLELLQKFLLCHLSPLKCLLQFIFI